jgi:hypothetical protein
MISSRVKPSAHLDLAALALSSMAYAAEPFRVWAPDGSAPNATVLLVPGCSGFVARNGINHYDERANQLRAAGYFVVFVDYLSRRHLMDCAGRRDVSHGEVAADILEAAAWVKGRVRVSSDKIFCHRLVLWWRWCPCGIEHHASWTANACKGSGLLFRLPTSGAVVVDKCLRAAPHGRDG